MAPSKLVSVYLKGIESVDYPLVADSVPVANLVSVCGLARTQLDGKNNKITRFILPSTIMDLDIAKRIVAWIKTNDPKDWKPLTVDNLNIDHFEDLVNVYATAYGMMLDRDKRGNRLRQEIIEYIHAFPLTRDEFAMILEILKFDTGLGYSAKNQIMHLFVKGKRGVTGAKHSIDFTPPDMDLIEAYCKEKGFWTEMKLMEAEIRAKMASRDAQDARERRVNAWREQAAGGIEKMRRGGQGGE